MRFRDFRCEPANYRGDVPVTYSRIKLCRSAVVVLGSAGLLFSTSVEAAPGWSNFMTINTIIASDNGTRLEVTGNNNPMGCSVPSDARLDPADTNYAFISSSALTAYSSFGSLVAGQTDRSTSLRFGSGNENETDVRGLCFSQCLRTLNRPEATSASLSSAIRLFRSGPSTRARAKTSAAAES